jgi:hypothetical protein
MNKIIRKSLLLFAIVAALTAFAVPSMASAVNWSPLNSYQITTSPTTLTVNVPGLGDGLSCSSGPILATHVRTPASSLMDVLASLDFSCTGTGWWTNCNVAMAPTGFPWTVDGASLTNVTINSLSINGTLSGSCGSYGTFNLNGSLAGGHWSQATHSLAFTNATGVSLSGPGYSYPATVSSSQFISDPAAPFIGLS